MAYNKVTYKDEILMDITDSTVTPETLSEGVVAYGANGERIVGTNSGSVSAPLIVHSLVEDNGTFAKENFKSITIMTESVGDKAFEFNANLESVELVGVTSIGVGAFGFCSSLTSVGLPDSVTSIGDGAFQHCSSLSSIIIPQSVTSIGRGVFNACSKLPSINIPNGITNISENMFYMCSSLTSITIPNSVSTIGGSAFAVCSKLESVIIPDSVTSIGNDAFSNCEALTSVTVPHSVTSIGSFAFSYCDALTEITYEGTVAEWTAMDTNGISNRQDLVVHCTDGDTLASYADPNG